MGRFDDDDDEAAEDVLAPKEPQVTSNDPEERKAARALRIKRRQEAIRRAKMPEEEIEPDTELGAADVAMTDAAAKLQRLTLDGTTMVTNVKVACDEREVLRRIRYNDAMTAAHDKIEEEMNEAQTEYDAIPENFHYILSIRDPLDMDQSMKEQMVECDLLIQQKNELIKQLKQQLANNDWAYFVDLKRQDVDITLLCDRIEKQVTIMQKAYEQQLALIDDAMHKDRDDLLAYNNKRWEALFKQRDKDERKHIEDKIEKNDIHNEIIEAIMWDHLKKFREAKIELETLIQELQKELEKLKVTCLVNTEKIGYNYQILKKREEENIFVRAQQKRKLNKMADVANALRAKIKKAASEGQEEEKKSNQVIIKLIGMMESLEKKNTKFSTVNNYKFGQVWRMNFSRCSYLARGLRQAETTLHAHVLAEPPPPPPPPPPKNPLAQLAAAQAESEAKGVPLAFNSEQAKNPKYKKNKTDLVRHILSLVSNNTGFLIEDRLLTLLKEYYEAYTDLCSLDAIFTAFEIESEDDIELLCNVFLTYAFCPTCTGVEELYGDIQNDSSIGQDKKTSSMIRTRSLITGRSLSASTSRSVHMTGGVYLASQTLTTEDQNLIAETEEILAICGDGQAPGPVASAISEGGVSGGGAARRGARGVTVLEEQKEALPGRENPFLCPEGHMLHIEPMNVLHALGEFISQFEPVEKQKLHGILEDLKPPTFDTPSRSVKTEDIEQYWLYWKSVFPPEKDQYWNTLIKGLTNYLTVLKERDEVHSEVMQLRARNSTLRRIVLGGLPAIPPPKLPRYLQPESKAFVAPKEDFAPDIQLPNI